MGESEADRNRLAEVFRQYNDTLVNYLAFRVKSRQEAAEIAQETYVRMLAMSDLGRITDLQSYLFRVANNIAVDRLRREQVQRRTIGAQIRPRRPCDTSSLDVSPTPRRDCGSTRMRLMGRST